MTTIPLRSADHGLHRPASHPVLRRQRHGGDSRWFETQIAVLEQVVDLLEGCDLNEGERDRYERALTRGHADNLWRVTQRREET